MALKYTIEFVDRLDNEYRIEIDSPDYADEPISLSPGAEPLIVDYNGNNDDDIFKKHIIPSSITMQVVSSDVDIDELMYINDASFKCRVYRLEELYWSGWVVSDGIQEIDSGIPYDLTIKAIDGLELMNNVNLTWNNYNASRIIVDGQEAALRSPMNAYRVSLFGSPNLDNPLPIRWNSSLQNDVHPDTDMLAGLTQINPNGDLSAADKTCYWWLENLSKSAVSWLYQKNGYWYINNYFDAMGDGLGGLQIGSSVSENQVAEVYDEVEVTEILPEDTVNENWFWFGKKPLGKSEIIYNDTKYPDNNIFPNGGFDNTVTGVTQFWHSDSGNATLMPEIPINGKKDGNSLEVSNLTPNEDYVTFGEIPIDTEVLYKDTTLGFIWSPVSGYETDGNGAIDFSKRPIHISVKMTIEGQDYYLNEFGFWSDKNLEPGAWVTSYDWHSSAGGTLNVTFDQSRDFQVGDEVVITAVRDSSIDLYSVVFDAPMSVQDGVAHVANKIPDASNPNDWTVSLFGVDDSAINHAFTRKEANYYRRIYIEGPTQLRHNDVLTISFISKGSDQVIKMPAGQGVLKFGIWSKPGSVMLLDDAYMTVNNVHDVYTVSIPSSKNSKETYEMGISSGYSGNMVSSYGDRFDLVNESAYWNGGMTLTEIYGRRVMDVRNRPCRVFSGDIDKIVPWGLFTLMGKRYAPLSMRINIKDMISSVVGVEFNPNPVGYGVDHKSSGDDVD